ncbi:protease inhibitor SIL-V5 [Streptomyces sp. ISL-98]|uniref:SSI family serine proteinase inhibitor n=1 Tax=Streptomyces sp. ISL-98 TaxID=2819192 RepID=UPI001BE74B2C|nr:SSI family serine proteinase inhibitor [Streptomyces sp. ISL-98]MBT2505688.1 protease inhibitor SIL-V5 [Streptomyces sp. ISL-98]
MRSLLTVTISTVITVSVTAAATLALTGAVPPAQADDDVVPGPKPTRGLFLTVSGSENTWIRGVMLNCPPKPSGHHPEAAAACAALDKANGEFDALPVDSHPCTKRFDPVTVSATGTWRDRPTAWNKTYSNPCELDVATGAVFRF